MKLSGLLALLVALSLAACKDTSGQTPYDTYQDCFDEHIFKEKLAVPDSILSCCLDHKIGGVKPVCMDTKADCINYLTANLNQTSASTVEVMDTCDLYVMERSMMGSGG